MMNEICVFCLKILSCMMMRIKPTAEVIMVLCTGYLLVLWLFMIFSAQC